ncbi:uncharacterized protein LOC143237204 isoform X1 [Tachypleus tridentatus]|uniref:uncharacterized protein LOC143237204 isoform X1 n=1 Tax=Tachypleus tridentatus TaxID=6853 RepID=UPI003FCFAD90
MGASYAILPVLAVLLSLITIILELVALPLSYWAYFEARGDLGNEKEEGHYGFWTLCSLRAPHFTVDCDPLDTFFKLPPHSGVAGALGITHLLIETLFFIFAVLRVIQVVNNAPNICLRPKIICLVKVTLSVVLVFLVILVVILVSVGENQLHDYIVWKGAGFWLEVAVLVLNVLLTLTCAFENIQYWQLANLEAATRDPMGDMAETYGNPSFYGESPGSARKKNINPNIAVTPSSGKPYLTSEDKNIREEEFDAAQKNTNFRSTNETDQSDISQQYSRLGTDESRTVISIGNTLTYQNPAFYEHSPRSSGNRNK